MSRRLKSKNPNQRFGEKVGQLDQDRPDDRTDGRADKLLRPSPATAESSRSRSFERTRATQAQAQTESISWSGSGLKDSQPPTSDDCFCHVLLVCKEERHVAVEDVGKRRH